MNRPKRDLRGRFASPADAYEPERVTQRLACVVPSEMPHGVVTADGYEDALLGYLVPIHGGQMLAVYSRPRCLEILQERDGMDEDGAEEFFEFNTIGSLGFVGAPLFVDLGMDGQEARLDG